VSRVYLTRGKGSNGQVMPGMGKGGREDGGSVANGRRKGTDYAGNCRGDLLRPSIGSYDERFLKRRSREKKKRSGKKTEELDIVRDAAEGEEENRRCSDHSREHGEHSSCSSQGITEGKTVNIETTKTERRSWRRG